MVCVIVSPLAHMVIVYKNWFLSFSEHRRGLKIESRVKSIAYLLLRLEVACDSRVLTCCVLIHLHLAWRRPLPSHSKIAPQ